MNSDDILWNPRLLHHLVRERRFEEDKFIFVDVGMRAGIPQHWTMLKDQLHVIGFEPDVMECQRLNRVDAGLLSVCARQYGSNPPAVPTLAQPCGGRSLSMDVVVGAFRHCLRRGDTTISTLYQKEIFGRIAQ
jgi:hypothetical protein